MPRSHACPACQNTLWVVYDVLRDVELDDSDAPDSFRFFVKQSAYVASASCPVCGLALSQSDMVLTDIPFVLDLGDDEATPDEIEGWGTRSTTTIGGQDSSQARTTSTTPATASWSRRTQYAVAARYGRKSAAAGQRALFASGGGHVAVFAERARRYSAVW
jgi:hypothetical protein